ncbi:MAG: hypothetical protein DMG14_29620 [Acidobacteria bacterium]|nr:MAG: hypothetical protein DMG14_29620 [Acidobacteriota bacterium]
MNKRIQQLRQKIREATGQKPVFGTSPDCPPEVEEAFLENVLAHETSPKRTLLDVLGESGVEVPRPKKLTDGELTAKLWEVIYTLLRQSIVIGNTDDLSDRELYTLLWNETLRQEFIISPRYTLYIDMTRTGVDGGMPVYLKYYASEAQRNLYLEAYPDFKMPEHVDPPRRRDHLIPDVPRRMNKKHVN